MNTKLNTLVETLGPKAKRDVPLSTYTTFRIGGPADVFFVATTQDELVHAIVTAREAGVPVLVIGGGSNIIVGDRGFRGLVIKNATRGIHLRGMKGALKGARSARTVYVEVDSGVIMNIFVRFAIEEGLQGVEMHLGLPGTIGGAMYMNSKWTNPVGYIGDVVYQANILTPDNKRLSVPRSYFKFGYDQSILQTSGDFVVSVTFALTKSDKKALWEKAEHSIAYRRETQPHGVASPGCTFRNIPESDALRIGTPEHTTSAGYLIDQAGLKGTSVGGATISDHHANFIVNTGKATAKDVVTLIEKAREKVQEKFGVRLEEEIVRIGEF